MTCIIELIVDLAIEWIKQKNKRKLEPMRKSVGAVPPAEEIIKTSPALICATPIRSLRT